MGYLVGVVALVQDFLRVRSVVPYHYHSLSASHSCLVCLPNLKHLTASLNKALECLHFSVPRNWRPSYPLHDCNFVLHYSRRQK